MEIKGKKVKLQIWDTAGQERFKNVISSYYRGASGILLIYDITDRESFESLSHWLIEIEKNARKNVKILLMGNNCDLEDKRQVSYQEGKDFAAKNNLIFFEASAKDNINIKEAFELLTEEMINSNKNEEQKFKKKTIHLSSGKNGVSSKNKNGCC